MCPLLEIATYLGERARKSPLPQDPFNERCHDVLARDGLVMLGTLEVAEVPSGQDSCFSFLLPVVNPTLTDWTPTHSLTLYHLGYFLWMGKNGFQLFNLTYFTSLTFSNSQRASECMVFGESMTTSYCHVR